MNSLEEAIDATIEEMTDDFMIKSFLLDNRAEVKRMCITEYDEEKTYAAQRREGRAEGAHEKAVSGAMRLIKRGKDTIEEIADIMELPLDEVIALEKQIKAAPV